MILLSNTTTQTIPVGGSITFDRVILHTGCGESHRQGSASVKIRNKGIYELHFAGNISGATVGTPVQLNIQADGETLLETTMIYVPSTADELNNVATATLYRKCCCECERITVVNTGTTPLTIGANSALFVKRVG